MSPYEQLIQNVVGFVEVEYDVQLAYIAEVSVQYFHEEMDLLQHDQLVVALVHARDEEQRRIALVNHLITTYMHKYIHTYISIPNILFFHWVEVIDQIRNYCTRISLYYARHRAYIHTYVHTKCITKYGHNPSTSECIALIYIHASAVIKEQ